MAQMPHKQFDLIGSLLLSEGVASAINEGDMDATTIVYDRGQQREREMESQTLGIYSLNKTEMPILYNPAQYILNDEYSKTKPKPSTRIKQKGLGSLTLNPYNE